VKSTQSKGLTRVLFSGSTEPPTGKLRRTFVLLSVTSLLCNAGWESCRLVMKNGFGRILLEFVILSLIISVTDHEIHSLEIWGVPTTSPSHRYPISRFVIFFLVLRKIGLSGFLFLSGQHARSQNKVRATTGSTSTDNLTSSLFHYPA